MGGADVEVSPSGRETDGDHRPPGRRTGGDRARPESHEEHGVIAWEARIGRVRNEGMADAKLERPSDAAR